MEDPMDPLALMLVTDRIAEAHRQIARERLAEHARRASALRHVAGAGADGRSPRETLPAGA
jgi:hypothetical protein